MNINARKCNRYMVYARYATKGLDGEVSIGTRGREQNFFHLPLSFFLTKNQKSW
jgi:hypothetical protein